MGVILDDGTVYVVITVVNGYKNIYGHVLFSDVRDANMAMREAKEKGAWDEVYVTRWDVI